MNFKNSKLYFVTLTVNDWKPVFLEFPATVNFIYDSFDHLTKNQKNEIYGFVIMKDHLHFLCNLIQQQDDIYKFIHQIKKYTGKNIIKYLEKTNMSFCELFLSKRQDRKFKFWKIGQGALHIQTQDILVQKLRYIHSNPCSGLYKTVDHPIDYSFSSALAYFNKRSNFSFLTVLDLPHTF